MDKSSALKMGAIAAGTALAGFALYKIFASKDQHIDYVNQHFKDEHHDDLSVLAKDTALERSAVVSNTEYTLVLSFLKGTDTFEGFVVITYD
jgi:aminopeptidase N